MEALKLVKRLALHWPNMVVEQGSEQSIAREYELQFKGYAPDVVDAAATVVIGEPGRVFAPKPGELKAATRAEFVRRVGRPERAAWKPDDDDRPYVANTAEEVARRAAQCLVWRKQYGLDKIDVEAKAEEQPWRPLNESELASLENLSALMARKRG